MAIGGDTIAWARPRVQNFSEDYARKFIGALQSLDGAQFDKAEFFATLVNQSVVGDPSIPPGKTTDEVYAKRWDSYLAPIRPFGLGFVTLEQRQQSPNPPRSIWRVSQIALAFINGEVDYRSFMALQLARTQFPKITMPLKEPARPQLEAGAAILPLRLFVETVDALMSSGDSAHLSHNEICQLQRCRTHADVGDVTSEIVAHRKGSPTPSWISAEPADLDILINDLNATGFFRRLASGQGDQPLLVPSYPRFERARSLVGCIDWIYVLTPTGIEKYYERLMASPTETEREILAREPQKLRLDKSEAVLQADELTGVAAIVGGLDVGDEAFLEDAGRLVRVVSPAASSELSSGKWRCRASVKVEAFVP